MCFWFRFRPKGDVPRPSDFPSPQWREGGRRPDEVNPEELFLNNMLLENGHARRYDKVALADWEDD
jgi:hypothetical protein